MDDLSESRDCETSGMPSLCRPGKAGQLQNVTSKASAVDSLYQTHVSSSFMPRSLRPSVLLPQHIGRLLESRASTSESESQSMGSVALDIIGHPQL